MSDHRPTMMGTSAPDELAAVIASGDNDRVKELLEYGVDVNARAGHDSFLAIAGRAGNHVAMTRLLKAGATASRPMLRDALVGGNPRCLDKLLDELHFAGVEVDVDVELGQMLYERALLAGLPLAMVRWLGGHGVDLAARSAQGQTLHAIAQRDGADADVVAFLAEQG